MVDSSEPYIPLARAEVRARCRELLDEADKRNFERFANLLTAWYHYDFQASLETLKDSYNNDPVRFARKLDEVARAANFTRVTEEDINRALDEESMFRLRLFVNFDQFDEIVFYRRGDALRVADISAWFGLKKRRIEFRNYEHVLIFVRFKHEDAFEDPASLPFEPGTSMLKLFENVPRADLEMLFPNTEVRMRTVDKLLIGVPAFVSGIMVVTTKVGGTLLLIGGIAAFWLGISNDPVQLDQATLVALMTGAGALGAYLWKQYSSFKNRKIRFMKALAENLYFKTLANDTGVLSYLIDRAEESEAKEVLIAFTELMVGSQTGVEKGMSMSALKSSIDQRFGGINFDVDDAVGKLVALELATCLQEVITPVTLVEALRVLDQRWDGLFDAESL